MISLKREKKKKYYCVLRLHCSHQNRDYLYQIVCFPQTQKEVSTPLILKIKNLFYSISCIWGEKTPQLQHNWITTDSLI